LAGEVTEAELFTIEQLLERSFLVVERTMQWLRSFRTSSSCFAHPRRDNAIWVGHDLGSPVV